MNNRFDRRSRSLWMDVDVAPNACELEGDQSADTVIIGSGIAGISTAYELAIDRRRHHRQDVGTSRAALRRSDVGDDQAARRRCLPSVLREPACDFRRLDGYLFQALNTDSQIIDDELDAVRRVGAPVDRLVGVKALAGCGQQHALRYPRQ